VAERVESCAQGSKEDHVPSTSGRQVKPRAKKDSSEVRTRILEASRRLLARGGLEALTISQIAAEAGVYSSAVFYHFGGKEGLLIALSVELLEEATSAATPDLLAMPLGRARLNKVVESYFMIGGYEVQSGSMEMQVPAMRTPELRENVIRLYDHGKDRLAEALGAKEHPEQREFLRLAGEMVLSFTDGLNLQVLMNPDADYGPVISLFQDMLYRTLAPALGLHDSAETSTTHSQL
jgi:AcrR family transcriptional regulator